MASSTPTTWEEIQESIANGGCPGCGGRPGKATAVPSVRHCQGCGGIFGSCTAAEGLQLVRSEWAQGEAAQRAVSFDLTITDGGGRRHGWFDPVTRRITQTG